MIINRIKNKNRTDLAIMFGELGFKRGAEIGVRRGEYSEILCTSVKSLEKLYSIDPWDAVFEDPTGNYYLRKYNPDISGDDYQYLRHGNVIQAVNNYVEAHKINTLNIMQPKEGDNRLSPQWWFIKQ